MKSKNPKFLPWHFNSWKLDKFTEKKRFHTEILVEKNHSSHPELCGPPNNVNTCSVNSMWERVKQYMEGKTVDLNSVKPGKDHSAIIFQPLWFFSFNGNSAH